MSRKGKYKFKKDPKQPSVTNLLPSANKTPTLQTTGELNTSASVNSVYREKRRRNTNDSSETLTATPPTPNQPKVKKDKKIPKMSNPVLEETTQLSLNKTLEHDDTNTPKPTNVSVPNSPPIPKSGNKPDSYDMTTTIELPEGPALTELQQMEVRLTKNMLTLLKPIQDNIKLLLETKETVISHNAKIRTLESENRRLTSEVKGLRKELKTFQQRIHKLENKSLDHNLIIHGIEEEKGNVKEDLLNKFYVAISPTINRDTPAECFQVASEVEVIRIRRVGKKDEKCTRPVSIELANKYDVEQIYENRFSLEGIYINREYNYETEKNRRLLRPFLKAAKKIPEFKDNCRLEEDVLVINSERYTKETLHKLPAKLNLMDITTKSNTHTVGFFGETCPLSNFYPSSFVYQGIEYHSSEQFIQHMKAKHFNDLTSARDVLSAETPLNCKIAAQDVRNYNHKDWCKHARELCTPGIDAKFSQNPRAMQSLLETGSKQLIECTKDSLWGTGNPIHMPNCLDKSSWKSPGILGSILEEVRWYHMERARSLTWSKTLFPSTGLSTPSPSTQMPLAKQPICPDLPAFTSSPLDNATRTTDVENRLPDNNNPNPT